VDKTDKPEDSSDPNARGDLDEPDPDWEPFSSKVTIRGVTSRHLPDLTDPADTAHGQPADAERHVTERGGDE